MFAFKLEMYIKSGRFNCHWVCEVTFFLALAVPGAPTRIDPTELCKALSCISLHAHQEEMLNGDCCFHHAHLIHFF